MFRPDPTIPFIAASREQVVALFESINQPQISIPGKLAQAAHGHLCALRNANGSYSAYVGLYLPDTAENVVYAREPREFPREEYVEAEAEGVHFLESLGFMLDNLNFRSLAADAQESTMKRVPLFSRPKRPARPSPTPSAPQDREPDAATARQQTALARFLASF